MHWLAVEAGVGEQARGVAEVQDGEVQLAVLLVDARAAPDDLLELGHALLTEEVVEYDDLAGLAVHACGEEL